MIRIELVIDDVQTKLREQDAVLQSRQVIALAEVLTEHINKELEDLTYAVNRLHARVNRLSDD